MLKRVFKILGIITLLALVILILIFKTMHFRWSDNTFTKKLEKLNTTSIIETVEVEGKLIRFVETGNASKQPIVFLHGSPGSSKDYKAYLSDVDLKEQSNMRAVDRPGYGYSNFGESELSVKKQADLIQEVVKDSSIIVGHSLGGPVAAAIAMYYPSKVKQLILLAPAVDPANENQFVNHIIGVPPLKYLFGKAIRVTFEEKLSHEKALIEIMNDWKNITCPVTVVHGKKDWIVPFENVAFLEQKLENASLDFVTDDEIDHIMIWTKFEMVKNLILNRL